MQITYGFKKEFDDLMFNLRTKYGEALFNIDGIGQQLDIDHFAKNFFNTTKGGGATADVSIDANANVTQNDSIAFKAEFPKSAMKLNSYYRLWKALYETHGLVTANNIIEAQLTGAIYVNDATDLQTPYSYHPHTAILARINGEVKSITMEELFKSVNIFSERMLDADCVDTNKFDIDVYDGDRWVKMTRILRHESHTDLVRYETKMGGMNMVTMDHPVILEDGSEIEAEYLRIGDRVAHYNRPVLGEDKSGMAPDMAYLIGAMACDGWVNRTNVALAQNNVANTRLFKIISGLFPIGDISQNRVTFGDRADAEWFKGYIGELSHNKHLPFNFLSWSGDNRNALLAGVIDTDGCVNAGGGTVDLRVTSFGLVQQVADLAASVGAERIRTSIVNVRNRDGSFVSKKPMFRVSFALTDKSITQYSDKVAANKEIVLRERAKDGRWDSPAVHKLTTIAWKGEWVYDITTESGTFYSNGIKAHNCYNFSCMDIAMCGLPMVNKIKCHPPKYLTSFKSQVEQFLAVASNSVLGATGLADLFIVMAHYVDKALDTLSDDKFHFKSKADVWAYVESMISSLIYTLNQPMRGGLQSPFVNVSVYDSVFLEKMLEGYQFPDVGAPRKRTVQQLQKVYLDVMNRELERTPVTFPVTTACFSVNNNGDLGDLEFVRFIARKNQQWGFINIYCGPTSTLSSCCFDGAQKTLTRSSGGVNLLTFKELHESVWDQHKRNLTIFHNGNWVKGRVIKVDGKNVYRVTTVNNKELLVTSDHINCTLRGDIETTKLTTEDYLMFSSLPLGGMSKSGLGYNEGYLVGAYLGDGSFDKDSGVILSLNDAKVTAVKPRLMSVIEKYGFNDYIGESENGELRSLRVYDRRLVDFIKQWVKGGNCVDKSINMDCLCESEGFRRGIIDGMYVTDGGNSNRIYTTSDNIRDGLEAILTSLGEQSIINTSDRTDEPVVIRGESFTRNYPLHCIRWYARGNKRDLNDLRIIRNNSVYFKVKSIELVGSPESVYCFEVKNEDEPYFTLPNGIITHNCRLRSDIDAHEYHNSFGAGSTKLGSLGVCTINMPRVAWLAKGIVEADNKAGAVGVDPELYFLNVLESFVRSSALVNLAKRSLIMERIKEKALPLYDHGFMDIKTQYLTVGVNGMAEACEIMGIGVMHDGYKELMAKMIDCINNVLDALNAQYASEGIKFNVEQTPSENSAIKLATKDHYLGYNVDESGDKKWRLYSNQFIPLTHPSNLLDRITVQGMLDRKFTGGAICHLNIEQRVSDPAKLYELIRVCARKGVIYWAANYCLQECAKGHMSVGKAEFCPECGHEIVNEYTRVVGFLTNTKHWHEVRRGKDDYTSRIFY